MLGARPADSPIKVNHRLHDQKSDLLLNPSSYQRLLGRLIYLTITRPELHRQLSLASMPLFPSSLRSLLLCLPKAKFYLRMVTRYCLFFSYYRINCERLKLSQFTLLWIDHWTMRYFKTNQSIEGVRPGALIQQTKIPKIPWKRFWNNSTCSIEWVDNPDRNNCAQLHYDGASPGRVLHSTNQRSFFLAVSFASSGSVPNCSSLWSTTSPRLDWLAPSPAILSSCLSSSLPSPFLSPRHAPLIWLVDSPY